MAKLSVAVLGTGLMGAPMAANILKAGYQVHAWNRTQEKATPLIDLGAEVYSKACDAVRHADLAIIMVTDGAAVADLLFEQEVASSMKSGAIIVDMSSIRPAEAIDHSKRLAEMGIAHLDAPVSGGTRGAEAGTLAIMAGGAGKDFARAQGVLETMGRPVRVGETGAGQLAKLANQLIVGVTIGVVAEAMLLAEQGGADPVALRDALSGGFADSIILQQHGERMTSGNFEPGGLSSIQLKDLNNALLEAERCGIELPLAQQARERYARLCDPLGLGDKDHSALYLELKERNNIG